MENKKKRVLITGCFDLIHTGHIHLLKEVAKLGDVYVILARDSTIKKWKKQPPTIPEKQRLEVISAIRYVKKAVLGRENTNFILSALDLNPDIIMLGPNQRISEIKLRRLLDGNDATHIKIQRFPTLYSNGSQYELNSSTSIKAKIIKQNNDR